MNNWIDIEEKTPPENERVIILIPFGMRVIDDTWTKGGFINNTEYVSHWQPLNLPGTYQEIMLRPKKKQLLHFNSKLYEFEKEDINDKEYFEAINEHYRMMNSLVMTQFKLRLEKYNND